MTITLPDGPTADIRLPSVIGALLGKAAAVTKIGSQTAASRAKHLRDLDSLATLLGIDDRRTAALTRNEQRLITELAQDPRLTALARASLNRLLAPPLT